VVKESQKEGYDAWSLHLRRKDREQLSSDAKHFDFMGVTYINLPKEISGKCLKSYRIPLA